jgi:hypothetical protein
VTPRTDPSCARGAHAWDPDGACCTRAGCPATLTRGLFGADLAREVDGFSAEGAGGGLEAREEQAGQLGLWGDA